MDGMDSQYRYIKSGAPTGVAPSARPLRNWPGGMIGMYALHQMSREPIYGWQLAERIAETTKGGWRPGAGAVYPILKSLVHQKLARIEVRGGRKVYLVTPRGRARLALMRTRIRDGGGRYMELRRLVLDLVDPAERPEWAIEHLRRSLTMFVELSDSVDLIPSARGRALMYRQGARELRGTLARLEHARRSGTGSRRARKR